MSGKLLAKLFEHNNWANLQIIELCLSLSAAQLDAEPQSAVYGSIRSTLLHLVEAQVNYFRLLTLPPEQRQTRLQVDFATLRESARESGEAFVALAQDQARLDSLPRLQTRDGFHVEAWVVLVQVINHATEHREQIKLLLTTQGITPPDIDGWSYGEVTGAMVPGSG